MIKISLIKPILNLSSTTFDATKDFLVEFVASSESQIYANEIEIFLNSNNLLAYSNKTLVPHFSLSQVIPPNTLINGVTYKIHLRTYDSNGNYSVWSDFILINCFSVPIIDISNVTNNGVIDGQSWIFQGSYSQQENVFMQSYQYILYDNNMIKLSESDLIFNDSSLTYGFVGFDNNKTYTIELQVTTQYNVTVNIQKTFTAEYIQPLFNNLITLTNNPSQASIDVTIEAIRVLGHSTGTVSIETGDWVNLLSPNSSVYFDSNNGFKIPSGDWAYQFWGKNIVDAKTVINGVYQGTLITKLYGQNNVTFELHYYDGAFHLYKYIGDFLFSHYISNIINATIDNVVYLFCQSVNDRLSLQCEIVS